MKDIITKYSFYFLFGLLVLFILNDIFTFQQFFPIIALLVTILVAPEIYYFFHTKFSKKPIKKPEYTNTRLRYVLYCMLAIGYYVFIY